MGEFCTAAPPAHRRSGRREPRRHRAALLRTSVSVPGRAGAMAAILALAIAAAAPTALAQAQAPAPAAGTEACPDGKPPCWIVADYWPYKVCQSECDRDTCSRGYGAYNSEEICCAPGVAFPEGCQTRPEECWVVENNQLKTCIEDQRKCLRGHGVFPSEASCCAASFRQECAVLPEAEEPCYVIDTYWPVRLCRNSTTLCGPKAEAAGVKSWETEEECCTIGAAFEEGCSAAPPPTPCWVVDSYWPEQKCEQVADVAQCNRGWGVYASEEICCAPNVAFSGGCSVTSASEAASGAMPATTATNATSGQAPMALPNMTRTPTPATAVPPTTNATAALPGAMMSNAGGAPVPSAAPAAVRAPSATPPAAAAELPAVEATEG